MSVRGRFLGFGFPLLACLLAANPAQGDEPLRADSLARRFPLSYCPFETRDVDPARGKFGLFFPAPGSQVRVTFAADNLNGAGSWNAHRIDNIVIVRKDVFAANSGPAANFECCYVVALQGFPNSGANAPALYFNRLDLATVPFVDLFDTDPATNADPARSWDLTHGAYYVPERDSTDCLGFPSSAPRNPESGTDCSRGALGLGRQDGGAARVSTSITVSGLVPGVEYVVTGWWDTQDFALASPLTVTVEGVGAAEQMIAMDDRDHANGVDELLCIPDPATGVAQLVGSLGDRFMNCKALAALRRPSARDRVFATDDSRLLELDPATGRATLIGSTGFSRVDGIAFHPSTGVLYGVTYGSNKIIKIDISTGRGTVVASHVLEGNRLTDLAFHPDGRAFILTNRGIYEVVIATGKKLHTWKLDSRLSLESLLWSSDGGTLYSAADRGAFKDLVTVDLARGTVSFVGATHSGFRNIEALAWVGREVTTLVARPLDVAAPPAVPQSFRLYQNVPNPFNPITRIDFDLPEADDVLLSVFDVRGRRVVTLLNGRFGAGRHQVMWSGVSEAGGSVACGLYYYTLTTSKHKATQRMVLVK